MSCPSSPDTPFNPTFAMPGPLQPPKSPALRAAEARDRENGLGLSTLSPPITPAPLAPALPPSRGATPRRAPSPLPSRAASPFRAPSPGPRELAPPPIADTQFADGDFELISADNVR
jgi:hypothetical protein